jgi:drug/metabolite transporter (DMT)-like permease
VRRADGLALAAMAGWGAAYAPSALLVDTWPPLVAAGARLGLAGLVLLVGLALAGRPLGPGIGLVAVAWLALTQTVLFYGTTFLAIAEEGAGLAAVLANTDILFVAVLAALFLDERLTRRQWVGLGLGLVGVVVVVLGGQGWPPGASVWALAVVGGALAWGLGTVTAARGVRGTGSPLALAGWQMLAGGAALCLWGALAQGGPERIGGRELALVIGLALVGSAGPLACFYLALALAPAARVSAFFFLVPIVGVITVWPLLGEAPGPSLVIGLVAVSAGLRLLLARAAPQGERLVDSHPPS